VKFVLYRRSFVNNSYSEVVANVKSGPIGDTRPQMDENRVHIRLDLFICKERQKYYDGEVKKPKELS